MNSIGESFIMIAVKLYSLISRSGLNSSWEIFFRLIPNSGPCGSKVTRFGMRVLVGGFKAPFHDVKEIKADVLWLNNTVLVFIVFELYGVTSDLQGT